MSVLRTRVRRAARDDVAAVAEALLESRRANAPDIPPMVHTDEESRDWLAGLVGRGVVWVAEAAAGADSAGVLAVLVLADGWIDQLYVAPDWTGQGVGAALVEHAKRASPGGLQLWTFQANTAAQRFYTRHGFVPVEHTDGAGNEEQAPDVRMLWQPSEP